MDRGVEADNLSRLNASNERATVTHSTTIVTPRLVMIRLVVVLRIDNMLL